ncbi:MAG: multidrug effflux MFS transporter [Rhodobacterales bacterium]|nr:multidrug effflux MFS transporter [Rhodobacterales bacterium]
MTGPKSSIGQGEFIALMAMLSATVAFSIDSMLPALPEIGAELSPYALNRAQLILTAFVLGMGLGTFFTGPLSDAFGRKPIIIGGAIIYCTGAAIAWASPTLEWMLAARLLQGLGAAGPRVVSMAIVRDLYSGRQMARIMSFTMIVFMIVPAIAPSLGAIIIAGFGWRGIFATYVVFSIITMVWFLLRQPETLSQADRRPLQPALLWSALVEVLSHPTTRLAIMVQTLAFSILFCLLSTVQPMFDQSYGQGTYFPLWFALIAVCSAGASALNARIIVRLGMRRVITSVLALQVVLSLIMIAAVLLPIPTPVEFAIFLIWVISVFFQGGLTIGNLNAMAMEPMGHIAGMAASVTAALATVGSVLIAAPIGQQFNGTPLPIAIGVAACATLAFLLARRIKRSA